MADNGNQTNTQAPQDSDEHKKSLKRSWKSSGPVAKLTVVFAGIAALSTTIYAIVAGGQLLVMRGQLHEIRAGSTDTHELAVQAKNQADRTKDLAQSAADQATALKNSNALTIASNRPWVGQTEGFASDVTFMQNEAGGVAIEYLWRIRNSGHRPAQVEGQTTGTSLSDCTMHPDYSQPSDAVVPEGKSPSSGASSRGMLLPGGQSVSRYREYIPHDKWQKVMEGSLQYCIYISLDYRDIDYPATLHHTTDCQVLVPQIRTFAGCTIHYAHAD
jgi:hypothetical protein